MSSPKYIQNCHEVFTSQQISLINQMICHSLESTRCEIKSLEKQVCHLEKKVCSLEQRVHSNAECTIKAISCLENKHVECKPDPQLACLEHKVSKLECQVVELQKADHSYVCEFKKINCKLHEYDETFCKISKIDKLQESILCKMQKQISTLQCEINALTPCHHSSPEPCHQVCELPSPEPCQRQCESPSPQPCQRQCESPSPQPCQRQCESLSPQPCHQKHCNKKPHCHNLSINKLFCDE